MEGSDLDNLLKAPVLAHAEQQCYEHAVVRCLKTFSNCIFVMRRRRREGENQIPAPSSLHLSLSLSVYPSIVYSFISLQIHIYICLCLCSTWIHFADHRHTQFTTQGKMWDVFCSCLCTHQGDKELIEAYPGTTGGGRYPRRFIHHILGKMKLRL